MYGGLKCFDNVMHLRKWSWEADFQKYAPSLLGLCGFFRRDRPAAAFVGGSSGFSSTRRGSFEASGFVGSGLEGCEEPLADEGNGKLGMGSEVE